MTIIQEEMTATQHQDILYDLIDEAHEDWLNYPCNTELKEKIQYHTEQYLILANELPMRTRYSKEQMIRYGKGKPTKDIWGCEQND